MNILKIKIEKKNKIFLIIFSSEKSFVCCQKRKHIIYEYLMGIRGKTRNTYMYVCGLDAE